MKKYPKYKQGVYKPNHPEKYKGKSPITLRSSWEFKFAQWCDRNPSIIEWGSESIAVTYYDPVKKRKRRYFIDFRLIIKDIHGKLNRFLVEIKPYKQSIKPVKGRKKESTYLTECLTYATNMAKWASANKFAQTKGAKFIILTEKDLMR